MEETEEWNWGEDHVMLGEHRGGAMLFSDIRDEVLGQASVSAESPASLSPSSSFICGSFLALTFMCLLLNFLPLSPSQTII